MFVFLDVDNVLKHIIELFLAEYRLGRGGLTLLRPLPRVLVATDDLVELGHPGTDHSVLSESGYVR